MDKQLLQDTADGLAACTGSVRVTATDGVNTATSQEPALLALHFRTVSGSTYGIFADGRGTVRREAGHPAGEHGTFQATRVHLVSNDRVVIFADPGSDGMVTSAFDREALCLTPAGFTTGTAWTPTQPEPQPLLRPVTTNPSWVRLAMAAHFAADQITD